MVVLSRRLVFEVKERRPLTTLVALGGCSLTTAYFRVVTLRKTQGVNFVSVLAWVLSTKAKRLIALHFSKQVGRRKQADRMISTAKLNTLLHLHPQPINVVVSHDPSGKLNLGNGLTLRCFQRLSSPHLAAQRCP